MDDHYPFHGAFGFDWRLRHGHGITWGSSLTSLLFTVWRPSEFLVERAEELAELETVMVKFEVKDVKFEENYVEVIRLVVNPPQIHNSRVDPYQI